MILIPACHFPFFCSLVLALTQSNATGIGLMTHFLPLKRCHYFVVFEADEEVDINANLFVSLESSNQHYHYLYATTTAPTTYVDKYSTT